nr:PREDICTED: sodium/bile acid cotransporter 4 [Struthio camelus australis]
MYKMPPNCVGHPETANTKAVATPDVTTSVLLSVLVPVLFIAHLQLAQRRVWPQAPERTGPSANGIVKCPLKLTFMTPGPGLGSETGCIRVNGNGFTVTESAEFLLRFSESQPNIALHHQLVLEHTQPHDRIRIRLGCLARMTHPPCALLKLMVSLWSLLVTLVVLFILTGTMLGPDLMAHIPASVYAIAVLMPLAGYALGYGLATVFALPPHCRRTVSLETGCQNVQLCTAILKLTFPPQLIGSMYMFPLLYALFQSAEAGLFVLAYKMYGRDSYKQDALGEEEDTDISYKKLKEEEVADTSYGTVTTEEHSSVQMELVQTTL